APASELAIYIAGIGALYSNRPNEAVALFRRIPAERSGIIWDVYGTRLASALHAAGRHDEELAETTRRLGHAPTSMRAMEEHARALVAVGRTAEVSDVIKQILTTGRDPTRSPGAAAFDVGQELLVHGHAAEAGSVFAVVVDWTRSLPPDKAATLSARVLLIGALYRSARYSAADSIARAALASNSSSVGLLRYHGLIAARTGNVDEADRTAARLGALTTRYLAGSNT